MNRVVGEVPSGIIAKGRIGGKGIMEVRYDKAAVKFLKGLPQKLRVSIREAIKGLALKPPKGDIRPLQGYKDGRYRLRVGKYRVIYRYAEDGEVEILVVMEIGSRGDIYK